MKKIVLLFLLIAASVQSQTISFADANLKGKLLEAGPSNEIAAVAGVYVKIDTDNDGEIQVAEAQVIDSLKIQDPAIVNLDVLFHFSQLKKLTLEVGRVDGFTIDAFEQLNMLDVSAVLQEELAINYGMVFVQIKAYDMPLLETIDFSHNNNSSVTFSNLPNLKSLSCQYTNTAALDLSGFPLLEYLNFEGAPITQIDLSFLPQLKTLWCNVTNITALDLSANPHIETVITVMTPQLASVNLTGAAELKLFEISDAICPSLDFSAAAVLEDVHLWDMPLLESLSFKNGHWHPFSFEGAFPSLAYVCADEFEVDYLATFFDPTIEVNSYCTPQPAPNTNLLYGFAGLDSDGNGCSPTEAVSFLKIKIDDGFERHLAYTGFNQPYRFVPLQGTFTVTPLLENPGIFTVSPAAETVTFDATGQQELRNFCLTANGIHPDVEVSLAPLTGARPGFDADYILMLRNKGNQVVLGDLSLAYNESVMDLVTSAPLADVEAAGLLTYHFADLAPFEHKIVLLTFNANGPMETPPVNIDDVLGFTAGATLSAATDETPDDNTFVFNQTVVGSFDPNDKYCLEGSSVNSSQIGGYLHYIINFENTGTAAAENIVVRDVIDSAQYDIETLQVLGSSHAVETRVDGDRVAFLFNGIQLQAAAHGYVVFKIKTKNTLPVNSSVSNKADIFFDYNFPITTNTATTTFELLSTKGFAIDQSISIAPNPVQAWVKIQSSSTIQSVQLFDVNGRILSSIIGNQEKIDISSYATGMYFIKIRTEKGVKTEKLLKK